MVSINKGSSKLPVQYHSEQVNYVEDIKNREKLMIISQILGGISGPSPPPMSVQD